MSYKVEIEVSQYQIVEGTTGLIVQTYNKEREARNMCRNLNLGSGFQGFTPSFFAKGEKSS